MTHAVTNSAHKPAYSIEMHTDHYQFMFLGELIQLSEVPSCVREELEPAAKKWMEPIG